MYLWFKIKLTKEMAEVIANHLVHKHFKARMQDRRVLEINSTKPRAIQPKVDNWEKRNLSLTLGDRHKFLQSPNGPRAINLDASNPAMANGSTFVILNQSPVAHCTVPSTSVLVSQQNIAVLHFENTVTSQHLPAAAPYLN